jgi:membrane protein
MKKKITFKGLWEVLMNSFNGFLDDKVLKLSGALAYFTIFSLGPMLIVAIFFADIFYGRDAIEGNIYLQTKSLIGPAAAIQIQEVIKNASLSGKTHFTAIIGFITLLVGATSVFSEIQDSVNMIWNLKAKPKKGWLKILVNRVLSFSVVVGLGFLLLVSLIITALVEAMSNHLYHVFPHITVAIVYLVNLLLTLIITTLLFSVIFKVLPDAKIKWKDVLVGSITTAILFMLGKFGITFYIGSSNIGSTYGTAGSLIVILIWIYYSAIILYFGAEFTKAYAAHYGSRIEPNQYAVWIKQIEVEEGKGSLKNLEEKKKEENEMTGDNIKIT